MDRSASGQQPQTAHQLVSYWWVDSALAVRQLKHGHPIFCELRKGHSIISDEMFLSGLTSGDFHVLMLPNYCAALVEWVTTRDGRTLNILTTTGDYTYADEALKAIISAAEHDGADMIYSVGRPGWKELVEANGFETKLCLRMRKVLK